MNLSRWAAWAGLLCAAAAVCVHLRASSRIELDDASLDRTIAALRAGERAAELAIPKELQRSSEGRKWAGGGKLAALGVNTGEEERGSSKKVVTQQALHSAWDFPVTHPHIETVGRVNTGEQYNVRAGDVGVENGKRNPSMFIGAGRDRPMKPMTPTANPPDHWGRLDAAGVNTGRQHAAWDDVMPNTNGMEDSYSFGSTPVREDTSPLATVGLLANVPSKVMPRAHTNKRTSTSLHAKQDAHEFFQNNIAHFVGAGGNVGQRPGDKMAGDLLAEARRERQAAIAAERRFEHKELQARDAERKAAQVRALAEAVGSAKEAVLHARMREAAAIRMFDTEVESTDKRLASLGTQPPEDAQPARTKKEIALDRDVEMDWRENKVLSTGKDAADVLNAISSLPRHTASTSIRAHAEHKRQMALTGGADKGGKSKVNGSNGSSATQSVPKQSKQDSVWCSLGVGSWKPFC